MEQTFAQSADMDRVDYVDHECLHEHGPGFAFGNAA